MMLTASGFAQAEWYRYSDTAMTTPIHLEFWAEDQAEADRTAESVLAVFHHVDRTMSRYRADSELSKVNREAANQAVPIR